MRSQVIAFMEDICYPIGPWVICGFGSHYKKLLLKDPLDIDSLIDEFVGTCERAQLLEILLDIASKRTEIEDDRILELIEYDSEGFAYILCEMIFRCIGSRDEVVRILDEEQVLPILSEVWMDYVDELMDNKP